MQKRNKKKWRWNWNRIGQPLDEEGSCGDHRQNKGVTHFFCKRWQPGNVNKQNDAGTVTLLATNTDTAKSLTKRCSYYNKQERKNWWKAGQKWGMRKDTAFTDFWNSGFRSKSDETAKINGIATRNFQNWASSMVSNEKGWTLEIWGEDWPPGVSVL